MTTATSPAELKLWPDGPDWPDGWPRLQHVSADVARATVQGYARREGLKSADAALLVALAEHCPWPFPSIPHLAELTGATVGSTRERLRKLDRHGLIERYPARLKRSDAVTTVTLYRLTIPHLHLEARPVDLRTCAHCGDPIPGHMRADAKYCKPSHKVAADKKRAKARRAG